MLNHTSTKQLSYLAEAQADTSRITAEIIRRKQELCQDECRQQIFALCQADSVVYPVSDKAGSLTIEAYDIAIRP
ncbi:MAG: hypothetical protein FWE76_03635 [Symbiobacteriaceae bacterium]|nr:hypothetical protein [Symbiobacteriaceae bacterium]